MEKRKREDETEEINIPFLEESKSKSEMLKIKWGNIKTKKDFENWKQDLSIFNERDELKKKMKELEIKIEQAKKVYGKIPYYSHWLNKTMLDLSKLPVDIITICYDSHDGFDKVCSGPYRNGLTGRKYPNPTYSKIEANLIEESDIYFVYADYITIAWEFDHIGWTFSDYEKYGTDLKIEIKDIHYTEPSEDCSHNIKYLNKNEIKGKKIYSDQFKTKLCEELRMCRDLFKKSKYEAIKEGDKVKYCGLYDTKKFTILFKNKD
jgi:hypothetical protein